MPLPLRAASAAILAVALALLPLALDRCSVLCETHHAMAVSAPSCHHGTPAAARIAGGATACAHHHNSAIAAASRAVLTPERDSQTGTVVSTSPADTPGSPRESVVRRLPPDPSSRPQDRSLSLRI
jgi:hypothetical protein